MTAPLAAGVRGIAGEFIRFALVGAAGFVVDAGVLMLAMSVLGLGPYGGRVLSYIAAATFTWTLNRRFTFAEANAQKPAAQWARFVMANVLGAVVNYGTYAALVTYAAPVAAWPVLGVAAGSVAGLAFNFVASKLWVFGK